MNKRPIFAVLTAAALGLALAGPGFAGDPWADGFASLSRGERQAIQTELQTGGFYSGTIDGAWGPGTARGAQAVAAYIVENSGGSVRPDISSPAAVQRFLKDLARARYSSWIYGEGGEGEM